FFLGVFYSSIALFLSLWIFEEYAGLVMVFLTVMACLPLMYHLLAYEEEKDVEFFDERVLLREHSRAIVAYLLLFLGMTVGFSFWYVSLPSALATNVFQIQTDMISNLNQQVTGNFLQINLVSKIFLNNVKVLIFCILFSFIYGSGALFILSWNASVIGAAAGNFIRTHLADFAGSIGLVKVGSYFYVVGLSLLRYTLHGVPEILAYLVAGIAGGILSVAVIHHEFGTRNFERILLDVSDLVLISVFILFFAALVEVFITPMFFT
ncbi:stage II sporulation protein M, partial [Candidatus Woesearchaeota archaeon]|nr:stage II sporulation protein M [Candidatus Woesearchaeota archaeon]